MKYQMPNIKCIMSKNLHLRLDIGNWKFDIPRANEAGQALVTLLIFMVIAITVTAAAVSLVIINSVSTSKTQQASLVYSVAESGAENGLLRLLRNPFYTGETLDVGEGTAVITVTGVNPKVITSVGTIGNFQRTIEIQVDFTNNIMTIQSWKEIP